MSAGRLRVGPAAWDFSAGAPGLRGRASQLDGLRAVAVVLVFLHHWDMSAFPGGFLGVDLFFALSGYLISSLLIEEFGRANRIAMGRFYARRALRLAPALLAMVVPVTVTGIVLGIGQPVREAAAGVSYLMDFYAPGTHGGGGLFAHTWSLAVEEQFYLVWPVLLLCGLRERWHMLRLVAGVSTALTAASGLCLLVLHIGTQAMYWSPLPHVAELGAGTALAFAVGDDRVRRVLARRWIPWGALVALTWGLVHLSEAPRMLYLGGFAILGLGCSALIGHLVVAPEGGASHVLRSAPLAWLGRRSYAFYLWHYPVLLVAASRGATTGQAALVGLPVTLLATALSWRFVETPFLRLKERRYQAAGTVVAVVRQRSASGSDSPAHL